MRYHKYVNTLLFLVFLIISPLSACSQDKGNEIIKLGDWDQNRLEELIKEKPEDSKEQINFLSEQFLGTPYAAHTLTGDKNTPEVFTVDLEGMDCFTYIDYVEALRLSQVIDEFNPNLKDVRYLNGNVSFENRNHFFSDWPIRNSKNVKDITYIIGGDNAVLVEKHLNQRSDGSNFLLGIPVVNRSFYYIPSSEINADIITKLNTGDYVGIYSDIEGLDVSHTGIVIKKDGGIYLRHASSKKSNQRVLDEDFIEYVKKTPGIVVYRPN